MPYCPQCGAEYREGFTRCHDCDVELLEGPPPEDFVPAADVEPFDPDDVPEVTTVFRASHMEAEIVRSLLEANEIPVFIRTSGIGAYPTNVGPLGEGEVRVPVDRRDEALHIIATSHHSRD
jgi:hypothetical protein